MKEKRNDIQILKVKLAWNIAQDTNAIVKQKSANSW